MRIIMEHSWIFISIFIFLAILLLFCLIRAIKGPTIADRVVAVNMMGTIVMVVIAMLAVYMGEGYLLDICLIYAMISFLAVVVLTKIYSGVHLEKLAKNKRQQQKAVQAESIREEAMTGHSGAETTRTEEERTEETRTEEIRTEKVRAQVIRTEEIKTERNKDTNTQEKNRKGAVHHDPH